MSPPATPFRPVAAPSLSSRSLACHKYISLTVQQLKCLFPEMPDRLGRPQPVGQNDDVCARYAQCARSVDLEILERALAFMPSYYRLTLNVLFEASTLHLAALSGTLREFGKAF